MTTPIAVFARSVDKNAPTLKRRKTMHALLLPILAFDDSGVATAGALFLVILSVAAIVRSKMA
jgi:hypothetical protein